jgi:hypothetical protein
MRLLRFLPARWWSPDAWKGWKRYAHWRLETYGAYHPDGRLNRATLKSLVKQFPSYYRWLGHIDALRKQSK